MSTSMIESSINIPHTSRENRISNKDLDYAEIIEPKICTRPQCLIAASVLQHSINLSANPCDDFYSYACGGWILNNNIPHNKQMWSKADMLTKQIEQIIRTLIELDFGLFKYPKCFQKPINYYKGCINIDMRNRNGYRVLEDTLFHISWPLIDPKWSGRQFTYKWDEVFAALNQKIDFSFLMSFVIQQPNYNQTISTLNISPQTPLLKLNFSEKLDSNSNSLNINEHKKYIKEAVKLLSKNSRYISPDIDNQIDLLLDFDIKLAKLKWKSNDNANVISIKDVILSNKTEKSNVKNVTIKEFMSKYNEIPLLKILDIITEGLFDENDKISENEIIKLHNVYYFDHLSQILSNTDIQTIANYIGWRLAYSLGKYTTEEFYELDSRYQKAIKKEENQKILKETCLEEMIKTFSYIIGRLFIDHHFPNEVKKEVIKMVKILRDTFSETIKSSDWITELSREKFAEKLYSIDNTIAFPDFILNDTQMEKYYAELGDIDQNDHFDAVLKIKLWANKLSLLQLRKRGESMIKTEFASSMPVTEVDAYYMFSNRIVITLAILQPPFYTSGLPAALNYGTIGSVIGHELNHAFDEVSSALNRHGIESDWRDNATKLIHKRKLACFVDQYNRFNDSVAKRTVDGNRTLNENISDNEGVRLAFKAYKRLKNTEELLPGSMKRFSSDQLFFLSFASFFCSNFNRDKLINYMETNAHAVPKYRILGSLSNLAEFSDAFSCKVGDNMNSENKCILW